MKASSQYRVLIVEDDLDASRHFARALREQGYVADVANDLKTALNLIDSKTYHAALVDIMLAGELDRTNRDGLEVLRRIGELNEGTRPIVLSGQNEPQLSADTLQEYKAVQYLDKGNIRKQGIKLVTDKMAEVLAGVRLLRYGKIGGKFKDEEIGVLTFMSGGSNDEAIWIDKCLRNLKPAGGYSGLKQFFETFCEPFLPLLRATNATTPMAIHSEHRFGVGHFWSKALGEAIILYVRNAEEPPPASVEAAQLLGKMISEYRGSHLHGSCHQAPAGKRSDYVANLRTENR
jgi:CheY-like chemotaxis protein